MGYLTKYREEIHEMRDRGEDDDSYSDLGWYLISGFSFKKMIFSKLEKYLFYKNSIF